MADRAMPRLKPSEPLGYLVSWLFHCPLARTRICHLPCARYENSTRSWLAGEGTLCRDSMPEAERTWSGTIGAHRSLSTGTC